MPEQLAITLKPERVTVTAGGAPAQVVAVVENQTSVIDSFALDLSGLNPDWFTLPVSNLALFPGEQKAINIAFHTPAAADVLAGRYDYAVRAKSTAVTGRTAQANGALFVALPEVLSTRLARELVRGQEATFELTVGNRSRTAQTVELSAQDPEGLLDVRFDPPTPTVAAGGSQAVAVQVHLVPGQVILAQRAFRFTIQARTADDRERAAPLDAQFVYVPVQLTLALDPARVKGVEGHFNLNVQNPGTNTVAIPYVLSATDKDGVLDISFQQRQGTLQPGTSVILPLTVRLKAGRKPEVKPYPFTVTVRQGGGGATAPEIGPPVSGEFVYEPPVAFEVTVERSAGQGSAPGRGQTDYTVKLNNPSHTGLRLSLRAQDTQNALDLFFANRVDQIHLDSGASTEVALLARLKFAPPSQQTSYPFTVTAHAIPEDGSSPTDQTGSAEFVAGGAAEPMLRMDLLPPQARGDVGRFQVRLTSGVSNPLQVVLRGRDEATLLEYQFEPPRLELTPGAVELVDLSVSPRDGRPLDPGQAYDFEVISWVPGMGTEGSTTRPGSWVYVSAGPAAAPLLVQLEPSQIIGDTGQFEMTLANQGNNPLTVHLRGSDDAEALEFLFQTPRIQLQPKEVAKISFIVRGREGEQLPGPYRYPFEVAGWVPGMLANEASVQYGELIVTEAPKTAPTWLAWQRLLTAGVLLLWMILPFILDPIFRKNETLYGLLQVMYQWLPAVAFPLLGTVLYGSNVTQVRGWRGVLAGWIGFGGILTYILPAVIPVDAQIFGVAAQPFVYLIFLPALLIVLFI